MVHGTASLAKRRFHGLMRPMKLKSSVRMSRKATSNSSCMGEMTAVLTCWKSHEFTDAPCRKEIENFLRCIEASQGNSQVSKSVPGKRLTTDEVNTRLRKFVWPQ